MFSGRNSHSSARLNIFDKMAEQVILPAAAPAVSGAVQFGDVGALSLPLDIELADGWG